MEFDFRPPPPPPVNPATNNAPLDFNKSKNKPPGPPGETTMTPEQQEQYQQQLQAQQEMQKMEKEKDSKREGSNRERDRSSDKERAAPDKERNRDRPERERPERPDRDRPDRDRSHDRNRERGGGRGRDFRNRDYQNRDRRMRNDRPNRYDRRDKEMDLTMQVMAMQGIGPQALTSQQTLPAANPPPPPPGTNSTPFYGNAAPPPPPGAAGPEQWGMDYNAMMQMMQDPNMMQMMQYQMMGMNAMGGMVGDGMMGEPTKNIVHCKTCTLFPPSAQAPPPTTRDRPVGCRTVFVGGLPDNVTDDDQFGDAVHVLVTWLERGDCNKRSCRMFYSMIQSTNSHVRRLMNDKQQFEEELRTAKEMAKQRGQTLLIQFDQIEKVFVAACRQKVWDHFTKAQRKNIDLWKKQAAEIKNVSLEELINDRAEEEMDLSDSEDERKKPKDNHELNELKDESDSLRCQVEAYKNELDLVKGEHLQTMQAKDRQLQLLQNTLKGMQQQLLDMKSKVQVKERTIAEMTKKSDTASDEKVVNGTEETKEEGEEKKEEDKDKTATTSEENMEVKEEKPSTELKEEDARIIALLAMFLHVHPVGASVDYMWSYLQCLDSQLATLKTSDLETILQSYPKLFSKKMSGVGASIEKRWFFEGFSSEDSPDMLGIGIL